MDGSQTLHAVLATSQLGIRLWHRLNGHDASLGKQLGILLRISTVSRANFDDHLSIMPHEPNLLCQGIFAAYARFKSANLVSEPPCQSLQEKLRAPCHCRSFDLEDCRSPTSAT